jgi:ribokinase
LAAPAIGRLVPRVICAGHVNWDVTLFVDRLPGPDEEAVVGDRTASGGGSASNVATALAGLDVDATLLGSVGRDDAGARTREELAAAGVDTAHVRGVADRPTTVKYLLVDETGQVAVLANDGANEAFAADDLPESVLAGADHLHLTGQEPATAATLARDASDAGVRVSVDPGRRLHERNYAQAVAATDLVFLNDLEAAAASAAGLVADDDPERTLVETRGSGGATLRTASRTVTHDGFTVECVDATGAGDAFAAGFLAARLDGATAERALAVGNASGAIATTAVGARTRLSWDVVEGMLAGA